LFLSTISEHGLLPLTPTVSTLEAMLGMIQRGVYEQFVPLIMQRVIIQP